MICQIVDGEICTNVNGASNCSGRPFCNRSFTGSWEAFAGAGVEGAGVVAAGGVLGATFVGLLFVVLFAAVGLARSAAVSPLYIL